MKQRMAILLLLMPGLAFANAGLPMLAIVWPLSIPAFIPVVAVESWIVRRSLGVSWRVAITQMAKANLLSTLIGIPLAWLAALAVEITLVWLVANFTEGRAYPPSAAGQVLGIILSAAWLGPFRTGGYWIVPLATMVLLVPFFFASFWSEAKYVSRTLCPDNPAQARRAIWQANLVSYLGLFIATASWLLYGLSQYHT